MVYASAYTFTSRLQTPTVLIARWLDLNPGTLRTMPNELLAPRRVEKPWGHELIWAETDQYVGKILHVKAGHALSLQYHDVKDETMHLLRGRMRLLIGPAADRLETIDLAEGQSIRIRPPTVHRVEAITDVDILEASTPHLSDVVRLEDRYGRG